MPRRLTVIPVPGHGAEDVLVGADGSVFTGTEDGAVLRLRDEGRLVERVGHTGGRPLGLELLPDGRLLVCDAQQGLLALDPATGRLETLLTHVEGRRILVCNNAAVHSSGDVYLSDSSQVHPLARWKADLAEDTRTGRLLRRSADGSASVVAEGLRFANGVALSSDESFVVVAESGGRSVQRHWLTGPRAGATEAWLEDLPGYPDNAARGSDGLIWVTIGSPTDPLVERIMRAPLVVRRMAGRLPERLQPAPRRTARVQAYDDAGRLVHDLDCDATEFHVATGVREHHGRVWLASLYESALAFTDLSEAQPPRTG